MQFSDAIQEVIQTVKRPDRRTDIKTRINRAIAFCVTSGTFAADLVELQLAIDSTLYAQSFDVSDTPFARFRKFKYIRPTGYTKYLTWRDPSRVFDGGCESLDVWYRAGNNCVFKLSKLQSTLEIAYYQYHATLVADTDEDWMLDEMWPCIHDLAAAYFFQLVGNVEEYRRYHDSGITQYNVYLRDLGDGVSRG